MITGLQKYSCGGCGNDDYYIYKKQDEDNAIYTECKKCKSITVVTIEPAKITLKWGDTSDGIMCI